MVLVHSFEVGASATADVFPRRGERRQSRLCRSGRAWIKTGTAPAVERREKYKKSGASYPLSRAKRAPLRGEGDETPGALRSGLRRNGPSLGVGRAEWETARTLGESTPYPAGGPSPPGPGLIPEGSRCCQ